jgi:hypothetical protein
MKMNYEKEIGKIMFWGAYIIALYLSNNIMLFWIGFSLLGAMIYLSSQTGAEK